MDRPEIWCEKHWQFARGDAAAATMILMARVMEHPSFKGFVDGVDMVDGSEIEAAVRALSPLCCLLGDDVVERIPYADDFVARLARAAARFT